MADFNDTVRCFAGLQVVRGTFLVPAGSVANLHIEDAAGIDDAKLDHRMTFFHQQAPGAAVVAATQGLYIVRAAGTVLAVQAAVIGALADDASRHVTIDLKKSTGGGTFATVLSAAIDLTSSSTARTVYSATIASPTLAAGDILELVVAVSGGVGNQAQGLVVQVTVREEAT